MISIKEVARQAGVSVATVSRVVNGNYSVTPATRERVEAAIVALNYTPNAVARSLKRDSTQSIGFLVSDISNGYFTRIAKAVEDALTPYQYNIIVCSTENQQERELSYLKMLVSKQVDAILLNTTGENNEAVAAISRNLPVVLLERRVIAPGFQGDFLTYDNLESVRQLVEHLLRLGHRDIGVINGPVHLTSARERHQAFVTCMGKAGLDPQAFRVDADFSVEGGYVAAKVLLNREQRPTALVAMNNMMAAGALRYLRQAGVSVPGDMSLVCVGEIDHADILYVQPTYATQNPVPVGQKAVELLFSRLEGEGIPNREIMFMPQLVLGNTTREWSYQPQL